jgi:hypothetical protein
MARPHGRKKSDHRMLQAARSASLGVVAYRERVQHSAEQLEAAFARVNVPCCPEAAPRPPREKIDMSKSKGQQRRCTGEHPHDCSRETTPRGWTSAKGCMNLSQKGTSLLWCFMGAQYV